MSQTAILEATGCHGGGRFTKHLHELSVAGFITAYRPFGKRKKDTIYRLTDPYSRFYVAWIERAPAATLRGSGVRYWATKAKSSAFFSWAGYAFENLCLTHIDALRRALDLEEIGFDASCWRHSPSRAMPERGAQIDLLLDRSDDTITICEIKFADQPFVIDRAVATDLMRKLDVFERVTATRKAVQLAMVCSAGLKRNAWSDELVSASVSLEDLFKAHDLQGTR